MKRTFLLAAMVAAVVCAGTDASAQKKAKKSQLVLDGTVQFAVYYENLYATKPVKAENAKLELQGTDLDEVWEGLIKSIGNIVVEGENTLVEQIAADDARDALQKKIEDLKAKAYKEKQPRRKRELINQVKELELQLKNDVK